MKSRWNRITQVAMVKSCKPNHIDEEPFRRNELQPMKRKQATSLSHAMDRFRSERFSVIELRKKTFRYK